MRIEASGAVTEAQREYLDKARGHGNIEIVVGQDEVKALNDAKLEARRKAFESQKP